MSDKLKPIVGPDGTPLSVGEREPITTEHLQAVIDWPPLQRQVALREHGPHGHHSMPHHAIAFVLADMGRPSRGGSRIISAQLYQQRDEAAFTISRDDSTRGRAVLTAGADLPATVMAIPAMMGGFGNAWPLPGSGTGRVCLEVTRLNPRTLEVVRSIYSDEVFPPVKGPNYGRFAFTLWGW